MIMDTSTLQERDMKTMYTSANSKERLRLSLQRNKQITKIALEILEQSRDRELKHETLYATRRLKGKR